MAERIVCGGTLPDGRTCGTTLGRVFAYVDRFGRQNIGLAYGARVAMVRTERGWRPEVRCPKCGQWWVLPEAALPVAS